ncbi:MAG: endonuclease domain-containing protein [Balneolaceae bacterium]|nr:endonuclease domain-containing protein [Balneolaceae bacterium]MCH8549806.1 endonuclease domain-containing protein [Balneolaceae bacterium]
MKRPIIPYDPNLKWLARKLRKNSTRSEIILWGYLKRRQMHGFDFHRQRPVDQFIVDFLCSELWLVIELDGYTHLLSENSERDLIRENRLRELGLRVIRFWDNEVLEDIDSVLGAIEYVIEEQRLKLNIS